MLLGSRRDLEHNRAIERRHIDTRAVVRLVQRDGERQEQVESLAPDDGMGVHDGLDHEIASWPAVLARRALAADAERVARVGAARDANVNRTVVWQIGRELGTLDGLSQVDINRSVEVA